MRRFIILVATLMCLALAYAVYCLVMAVISANEAEHTLDAFYLVLDITEEYSKQHFGKWPQSWADLVVIQPRRKRAIWIWEWPKDEKEVRKRIKVDFSLTLDDVLKMNPSEFTAIQQEPPFYPVYSGVIAQFIGRLQDSQSRETNEGDERGNSTFP